MGALVVHADDIIGKGSQRNIFIQMGLIDDQGLYPKVVIGHKLRVLCLKQKLIQLLVQLLLPAF